MVLKDMKTDVLVVGSGLAGTLFSLELAKRNPALKMLVISKKDRNQSSSYLAQGGIAAVLPDTTDSIEQHVQDTFTAGANTNNPTAVNYFVGNAPRAIDILESYGISFDKAQTGEKALALEGGHSMPRVLHHKDFTGRHIMQKLHAQLTEFPNIRLVEDVELIQLIQTEEGGPVAGAYAWDYKNQTLVSIQSGAVVLSTGGVGSLFRYTTNPATATGQGVALAKAAGAAIKDIVNIQFHPTALWRPSGSHLPLISEAMRGAGALLLDETGQRFMPGVHHLEDLAPRDVVARAIVKTIGSQEKPFVYLDATHLSKEEWHSHFPAIFQICLDAGIDPQKQPIPVVPAAHYSCGGVVTDVKGKTSVKNLYVLGETACTGLHGANRLASNSLLEATLMAAGLAEEAFEITQNRELALSQPPKVLAPTESTMAIAQSYVERIQHTMQTYCSIVKTNNGLKLAVQELKQLEKESQQNLPKESISFMTFNLSLDTALMIAEFSLEEKENKGVFFNADLVK